MNFNSKSVCEMQNKGFSCLRHQIVLIFWSVLSLGVGYSPTQSCYVLKVNIKHPSHHFKIHLFGFSLSLLRICFHPQCEILFSAFNPGDVVILLAVEQTIALFTQHFFSLSPSTGMINISSSSCVNKTYRTAMSTFWTLFSCIMFFTFCQPFLFSLCFSHWTNERFVCMPIFHFLPFYSRFFGVGFFSCIGQEI